MVSCNDYFQRQHLTQSRVWRTASFPLQDRRQRGGHVNERRGGPHGDPQVLPVGDQQPLAHGQGVWRAHLLLPRLRRLHVLVLRWRKKLGGGISLDWLWITSGGLVVELARETNSTISWTDVIFPELLCRSIETWGQWGKLVLIWPWEPVLRWWQ